MRKSGPVPTFPDRITPPKRFDAREKGVNFNIDATHSYMYLHRIQNICRTTIYHSRTDIMHMYMYVALRSKKIADNTTIENLAHIMMCLWKI